MKWMKLCLAVILFLGFAASANTACFAQEKEISPGGAEAVEDIEPGNITVDFKDADIRDVLKIVSYKSGINIVSGKDVSGTVTIRLVDVAWEKALEVILKNSGFVYERDEDIIRVTTVENLGKEELATEIFILNYASADEVSKSIKEILSDRGRIRFDQRTNQLIVTDIPTNLYKISKVVQRLDQKITQVLIEARLIETKLDEDERLGFDWTLQASASGSSRPTTFPFAHDRNYDDSKFFPQIDSSDSNFPGQGFPYVANTDFTFGTISFGQLQAALEIFKRRSDTKTLSNPKIVTLNNKEAIIHVGNDYNIPLYERNSSTGQMEITDYKTQKVGVKLTVTPHVNAEKEIIVDLNPEVSSFLQWDDYGNVKAPVFSVREATTQIMVKDGETIVIGGLIKEETVDTERKVPILGDLPLLEYIFSKTTQTVDTTDLIIFVTVKLLDSDGLSLDKQARLSEEE